MTDRIEEIEVEEIMDEDGNVIDPETIVWASADITGTLTVN